MPYPKKLLFILLLALLPTFAAAEQAFITDKLVIDIYTLRGEQGRVVASLYSGTAIEILDTDNDYAQIKTKDNKQGWIHSKYLTKEKPVSLDHLTLIAKHKKLTAELEKVKENLEKSKQINAQATKSKIEPKPSKDELNKKTKKIASLNQELKSKSKQLGKTQKEIKKLKLALASTSAKLAKNTGQDTTPSTIEPEEDFSTNTSTNTSTTSDLNNHPIEVDQGPFMIPFTWAAIAMIFSLIIGIIVGINWLDRRIRQKHGGVRFY